MGSGGSAVGKVADVVVGGPGKLVADALGVKSDILTGVVGGIPGLLEKKTGIGSKLGDYVSNDLGLETPATQVAPRPNFDEAAVQEFLNSSMGQGLTADQVYSDQSAGGKFLSWQNNKNKTLNDFNARVTASNERPGRSQTVLTGPSARTVLG